MKTNPVALTLIASTLLAATALADDNSSTQVTDKASLAATNAPAKATEQASQVVTNITTVSGVIYTNVVIIRAEPDGLVLKLKSGIRKIYFTELSEDVQNQFGYDPDKAKEYQANAVKVNKQTQKDAELQKKNEEWQKESERAAKWLEDRKRQDAEGEKKLKAAQARNKAEAEARAAADTRRVMQQAAEREARGVRGRTTGK